MVGTVAAMCAGAALAAIDAHDQAQEPPTDTADAVATLASLVAAVIWVALRWSDPTKQSIQLIRTAAAGIVIGAVVIGLGSVVYDPFVN
jgi:hypothetical protein